MLFEISIIAVLSSILVRHVYLLRKAMNSFPDSVPWIGERPQFMSRIRACAREMFAGVRTLSLGYTKYCTKGLCFVLPDVGFRPQAMIPPELVKWFVEQPESVLAAHGPLRETVGIPYLIPTMDMNHDMYIMDVVRKDLTRNLGRLQPEIFNDLRTSIDTLLGMDATWREIPLYVVMQEVLFKSSNRVFLGSPLCENTTFLRSSAMFSNLLGVGAVIVGEILPLILKPVFGYLLAIPIYFAQEMSFRYLVPEIKRRMAFHQQKEMGKSSDWVEPKDMLMWIVIAAQQRQDPKADKPEKIAQGLLFLVCSALTNLIAMCSVTEQQMLGGIHTSVVTITNVILDIISSPTSSNYYDLLREEALAVFQQEEDWQDNALVSRLLKIDSTVRESLRRSPVLTKPVLREVRKEDGLTVPTGQHFPKGAWLAIPSVGIHFDDRFYLDAKEYNPFRFVPQPLSDLDKSEQIGDSRSRLRSRKHQGLSTASETYLGFGFGRHSCPGRWFVALQLKLLLAYVVRHYEFERLDSRPTNHVFGSHIFPPQACRVKVKRR